MWRTPPCLECATSRASPSFARSHTVKSRLRTRDVTVRAHTMDSLVRVCFCRTSHTLRDTIVRHHLLRRTRCHVPFLQLVGTQLSLNNLLASLQEGEERVEVRFTADEATIVSEALALGECRCYVSPETDAQARAAGKSPHALSVSRVLYNQTRPFSSVMSLTLDELLQQPHNRLAHDTATEDGPPPLTLLLGDEANYLLRSYYMYNLTLHGYNLLRRSDGAVPALLLHTDIDADVVRIREGDVEGKEEEDVVGHSIWNCFGLLLTPLAAGPAVERRLWRLQRAFVQAATVVDSPMMRLMQGLRTRPGAADAALCQHMLSLVTGDYEGAHDVAHAARQVVADPARVATAVQPVRRALQIDDWHLSLSTHDVVRTGVDFFCRCGKASIVQSLLALPDAALDEARAANSFACAFCGAVHRLTPDEWQRVIERRGVAPA